MGPLSPSYVQTCVVQNSYPPPRNFPIINLMSALFPRLAEHQSYRDEENIIFALEGPVVQVADTKIVSV